MKTALCLSGGGLRATLFHLGALQRLNELGILSRIDAFTSVSGGSIINGVLALKWDLLKASLSGSVFGDFHNQIYAPIKAFCSHDLRTRVIFDWANPIHWPRLLSKDHSLTDLLAKAYGRQLGFDVQLSQLTNQPRFHFCATNLESGVNWVFQSGSTGTMGDHQIGYAPNQDETLARAVAASSSFTPVFPPIIVKRDPALYVGGHMPTLTHELERIALTDGGIYDNLGLEPAWDLEKLPFQYVLVSNAGRPASYVNEPSQRAFGRLSRSFDVVMNQVGALRTRWLIESFKNKSIQGGYWGLSSDHRNYELSDSIGYSDATLDLLTQMRTDLDEFSPGEQGFLINHGYALANVSAKKWFPELISNATSGFKWPEPNFTTDDSAQSELKNSNRRGILDDVCNQILKMLGV